MRNLFIVYLFLSLTTSGFCNSESQKYWIFFKDKGINNSQFHHSLQKARIELSDKVLKRRAKVLSNNNIIDNYDLALYQPYLDKLQGLNITVIVKSKWLNAVSAYLSSEVLTQIHELDFIEKIVPIVIYKRHEKSETSDQNILKSIPESNGNNLLYGYSYTQNTMINVPKVHNMGINGSGVLVGILDSGFKHDEHNAFSNIDIVNEYDFVNNDNITQNEERNNDSFSQHNHGTRVLSIIGGYESGKLIGPAYGAKFLLGKTEYVPSETIIEEDYWVSGLEWMEQNGADIVTTSVGYNDWYQYSDMDGNTAITTKATDIAVKKGVTIFCSMGNEGNKSWIYMTAPADGKHVNSVGSVTSSSNLSSFSSIGPTYDGRIKPDVVAMGTAVYYVSQSKHTLYESGDGTSFSTPQVAGVAALILSAHPYLTPDQVHEALCNTADNNHNPNNQYGWGLINAYEAIFYHGFFFSNLPQIVNDDTGHKFQIKIFSQDSLKQDSLFLYYSIDSSPYAQTPLVPISNENLYEGIIPLQEINTEIKFYFTAADQSNTAKSHPYYAPDESFTVLAFDTTISPPKEPEVPSEFILYQNYPNPFNSVTNIKYELYTPGNVKISIFNINGQLVRVLFNDFQINSVFEKTWDGRDQNNIDLASGMYFYKLRIKAFIEIKKMLLLR